MASRSVSLAPQLISSCSRKNTEDYFNFRELAVFMQSAEIPRYGIDVLIEVICICHFSIMFLAPGFIVYVNNTLAY